VRRNNILLSNICMVLTRLNKKHRHRVYNLTEILHIRVAWCSIHTRT